MKMLPFFIEPSAGISTDGHLRNLLENFADRVDQRVFFAQLISLMNRYIRISNEIEEKNRQLWQSDMTRRESQKIAQVGSWDYDLLSGKTTWSDTMRRILEVSEDDHVAPASFSAYLDFIHTDDRKAFQLRVIGMQQGIVPEPGEHRIVMPDGRVKWIQTRYLRIDDEQSHPISIHGTIQDFTDAKRAELQLKAYNTELENLVEQKVAEIGEAQLATIYALVRLAESRDDDTGDHIERTSRYCRLLADRLSRDSRYADQIDSRFIDNIVKASPLHDIGKVGIPDSILLKPSRLSPEEFEIMKTHVAIGYKTLNSVQQLYPNNAFIQMGLDITLYHHEKWDGSGYQNGLTGEDIPLAARIMAIADVYDALRSRRIYKDPYPHTRCVEIIKDSNGTHFDPALVAVFLTCQLEFDEIFNRSILKTTEKAH